MPRITIDKVAIGHWWAPCCLHDLQRVETEDDLETARDPVMFCGAWDTVSEAVDYLIEEFGQEERVRLLHWFQSGEGENPEIAREIERRID